MDEVFEGHEGRECGEHRPTGARAWCFSCSEWCYPEQPCKGCERPKLEAEVVRLRGLLLKHGDHLEDCYYSEGNPARGITGVRCTCGWVDVERELREASA